MWRIIISNNGENTLPVGLLSSKETAFQFKRCGFHPWVRKTPWRKKWQLQYFCLENIMDRGAWQTTVHGVAKESDSTYWLSMYTGTLPVTTAGSSYFPPWVQISLGSGTFVHEQLGLTLCDALDYSMPGLFITNSQSLLILCWSSRWCHPTILFSVVPFSSCLWSFPASGTFSMNQVFTLGGQSIGASASALVLPKNIQDWFPLALTCLISWLCKGLSRVFSNITVQKHQFFGAQLSL